MRYQTPHPKAVHMTQHKVLECEIQTRSTRKRGTVRSTIDVSGVEIVLGISASSRSFVKSLPHPVGKGREGGGAEGVQHPARGDRKTAGWKSWDSRAQSLALSWTSTGSPRWVQRLGKKQPADSDLATQLGPR